MADLRAEIAKHASGNKPSVFGGASFGADLAARRPANPITLCDDRGVDFVTVAGHIPMAVHTAEDDVVDMRTGKAVRAGVVLKRQPPSAGA